MPILIWRKKSCTRHSIKDTAAPTCKTAFFFIWKLKVYLFNILLGRVYKKIPEATYTYIYCTSVKDYLLNLLGNVEAADVIAPHVTQLRTLLSEPACRLIKPIEIDYNFIEIQFPGSYYKNEFLSEVLSVASTWKVSNEGEKVVSSWTSR